MPVNPPQLPSFIPRVSQLCFVLAAVVLGSWTCPAQEKKESPSTTKASPDGKKKESDGFWEKLVMHPFRNSEGVVTVQVPLPASWQVKNGHAKGEPTITGPNGIKVIDFPPQNFTFPRNAQMQQVYRASGQRMRAMPGIEQLIHQDWVPWATGQGLTFVRQYEIPEVSKIDKWYNDQLYKPFPDQMTVKAYGTEWKHSGGSPFFIVLHLVVGEGGGFQNWYYFASGLQAEKAHFETARKQFIFGLANAHYLPGPIMTYNQREAEKAGRSWAEHNRRMAQNQAAFEASQRAFVNRSRAINDSIMQGWRDRNAASDRAQEQFIDTINERTKVLDSSTGQRYKVDSFSNHYWMNRNGEYFGTDKIDYNPNLDQHMNEENWRKLERAE